MHGIVLLRDYLVVSIVLLTSADIYEKMLWNQNVFYSVTIFICLLSPVLVSLSIYFCLYTAVIHSNA